jgi:ribokinase
MSGKLVVVGSLNWDVTLEVASLPEPGETVSARQRLEGPGGKGANQARTAALLGAATTMVGCVGDDHAGQAMLEALAAVGVETDAVATVAGASGGAVVLVEEDGENEIVIDAGANAELTAGHLYGVGLDDADVAITNLEIPFDVVASVPGHGARINILNPAPAPSGRLPRSLLDGFDVILPNRGELAAMTGAEVPRTLDEVAAAAAKLEGELVIVTLGGEGVLICVAGIEALHIPAARARPIDTSGAGDAFCGAIADGLARGLGLTAAAERAAVVAAIVTEHRGAAAPSSLQDRLGARPAAA